MAPTGLQSVERVKNLQIVILVVAFAFLRLAHFDGFAQLMTLFFSREVAFDRKNFQHECRNFAVEIFTPVLPKRGPSCDSEGWLLTLLLSPRSARRHTRDFHQKRGNPNRARIAVAFNFTRPTMTVKNIGRKNFFLVSRDTNFSLLLFFVLF